MSSKMAMVEITGECLGQGASILEDHGLKIVGSAHGRDGVVCLVIAGDALPPECADVGRTLELVTVSIRQEAYGRQRINRVAEIKVTPRAPVAADRKLVLEV